ncbi:MAG: polysaccharide pyruvyl transferase family protein [Bacillota bacterium]|nr:polysaccharide pyruvyl transferase family protein [Bacillota bacterium]
MKKIAIVTLYDDTNIGNKLQNYAVQCFFEEMGFACETLPHWEMAHDTFTLPDIKKNICKTIGYPKRRAKKLRMEEKRKVRFSTFSKQYLKLGKMVKIHRLPKDLANQYDYFVTGSDQVWHNWTDSAEEIKYFMLGFANENQRLTISPSFGKSVIDSYYDEYKQGLNGFKVLTCREESGAELIENIVHKKAHVLLDPTMLIPSSYWYDMCENIHLVLPKKYILVYCLGNMKSEHRYFLEKTAKENRLEILDVYSIDQEDMFYTKPDEFLYYIQHASLVFTDSFHASVFSILFKKDFIVFDRNTSYIKNMTSRIDTLLKTFNLMERKMNEQIRLFGTDFSHVDAILEKERKRANELYQHTFQILEQGIEHD